MIENLFIHQKSAKCFSTSLLEISKKKKQVSWCFETRLLFLCFSKHNLRCS